MGTLITVCCDYFGVVCLHQGEERLNLLKQSFVR